MLRNAEELHGAVVSSKKEELIARMQSVAKELYELAGDDANIAIVVNSNIHKGVLTNTSPSIVRSFVDAWEEGAKKVLVKQN